MMVEGSRLRIHVSMWAGNGYVGIGNKGKMVSFLVCQVTDCSLSLGKKKKKTRGDHFKLRFRKNFQALLEEQVRGELA